MIKATVKNSAEDFKTFMKYTSLFTNKKIATFIVFEAGAFIALALALSVAPSLLVISAVFLVFGFLWLGMNLLTVSKATDKILKKSPGFLAILNEYAFAEASFTVQTTIKKKTTTNVITYDELYKVTETKRFFYLYVNDKIAYIIKKSCIVEGNAEQLRQLFTVAIDEKRRKLRK